MPIDPSTLAICPQCGVTVLYLYENDHCDKCGAHLATAPATAEAAFAAASRLNKLYLAERDTRKRANRGIIVAVCALGAVFVLHLVGAWLT